MIKKSAEANKIDIKKNQIILLYGNNEGHKNQIIKLLSKQFSEILNYEESQIVENSDIFFENLSTKSLFEDKKLIIIKRTTEKIIKIIEEISAKNIEDIAIVLNSDVLEKKSKLRNYFEKDKKYICTAFYPDNEQAMINIAHTYLKQHNISLSQSNLNLIVRKCNEDRELLINELNKLVLYNKNNKNITLEVIEKLTNINENQNTSLLIDYCLSKNKKKILQHINEYNFSSEDCIKIIKIFLNKSKKIQSLSNQFSKNDNLELTISSARPPIFWKDKEIVKEQVLKWSPEKIRQLIFELSKLELLVKKNIKNSINLIIDFMLKQAT